MAVIESADLYYKEGASDKVYHATIEDINDGYVVNFSYGRRGSALKTGSKTTCPTTLEDAKEIFDKLVKEKTGKGYRYVQNSSGESIHVVENLPDTPSEIQCVLLNPIDQTEAENLLDNDEWALQHKLDGVRFMLGKAGKSSPYALNRKGKRASIPTVIWNAVDKLDKDFLLDGELIGETFHVFDILEYMGKCLRKNSLIQRVKVLQDFLKNDLISQNVIYTPIYTNKEDKRKVYNSLLSENKEGVVFKHLDAHYCIGRPASGGNYLKFKFYSTCSCVVTDLNKKRSAAIGLYKGRKVVKAGNVTIPVNFELPEIGSVVEVKYLYARKQSGALYQPIYLGNRTDIDPSECQQSQLKYKAEEE